MLLAQFDIPKDRIGQEILTDSIKLSRDTANAWDILWVDLINPNNELWQGLCSFAFVLAAFSLIFVGLKMAAENVRGNTFFSELAEPVVWSVVILLFLKGNGLILSNTVVLLRDIGHSQVVNVLNVQLENMSLRQALQRVALTSAAQDQVEAILAQCQGQTSVDFADCIQEQQPYIDQVIQDAESKNGGPLQALNLYFRLI